MRRSCDAVPENVTADWPTVKNFIWQHCQKSTRGIRAGHKEPHESLIMAATATNPLDTAAQPPREFTKHTRACFRCKLVKTYEQVRARPPRPGESPRSPAGPSPHRPTPPPNPRT